MPDFNFMTDEERRLKRLEAEDTLAAMNPANEEADGRLKMSAADFPALRRDERATAEDALAQEAVDSAKGLPATEHERAIDGLASSAADNSILYLGKQPKIRAHGQIAGDPVDVALSGLTGSGPDNQPPADARPYTWDQVARDLPDPIAGLTGGRPYTWDEAKAGGVTQMSPDSATTPGPDDKKPAVVKQETEQVAPDATVTKTDVIVPEKDPSRAELPSSAEPDKKAPDAATKPTTEPTDRDAGARGLVQRMLEKSAAGGYDDKKNDAAIAALAGEKPGLSPWAMIADLALNKGRGIGEIIGMAEKQKSQWDHDQLALAKAKKDDAFTRDWRTAQLAQGLSRIENVQEGHGLQEHKQVYKEGRDAQLDNPDSEINHGKLIQRRRMSEAGAEGTDIGHDNMLPIRVKDRAALSAAGRQGALDTEAQNAERTGQVRGGVAADVEHARVAAHNLQEGATPKPITPAEAQAHDDKVRQEAERKAEQERTFVTEEGKNTQFQRQVLLAAQRLQAVYDKYKGGEDIPGSGTFDSTAVGALAAMAKQAGGFVTGNEKMRQEGLDAREVQEAQAEVANAVNRWESGANAPDKEFIRTVWRTGGSPFTSEEAAKRAVEATTARLTSDLRDRVPREYIPRIKEQLDRAGIRGVFDEPSAAPPAPPAAPAPAFTPKPITPGPALQDLPPEQQGAFQGASRKELDKKQRDELDGIIGSYGLIRRSP